MDYANIETADPTAENRPPRLNVRSVVGERGGCERGGRRMAVNREESSREG